MYDPRTQISRTHDHTYERNLVQNYANTYRNFYGDQGVTVECMPNHHQETMGSDSRRVISSPLWQNSPSPLSSPSQPLLRVHHNYRSIPPNSRAEAIVRAQWELMEMVKNMPESSYELTLKDIVEHNQKLESPTDDPEVEERSSDNKANLHERREVEKVKREENKKHVKNHVRSGSFEAKGVFLNMAFPFSLESKKKKKLLNNGNGLVKGGGERDWWKRKLRGSTDSDSSRTSGSSWSSSGGSSGGESYTRTRKKNGFMTGCYGCSNPKKQTID